MNYISSPDILSAKIEELYWQKLGLQYTASGYGKKIPTKYKVKINSKWHRVYCIIYSNIGTLYILKNKCMMTIEDYQIAEKLANV